MRKSVFVTATLDPEAAQLLQELADALTEGNRSQMVRTLIRRAARQWLLAAQTGYGTPDQQGKARNLPDAETNQSVPLGEGMELALRGGRFGSGPRQRCEVNKGAGDD